MTQAYSVYHFYLGDSDDDAEKTWEISNLDPCPVVGQRVSLWSTRDDNGDYAHPQPELMFEGVVTRIEHIIEERGRNAQENNKIHFVEVFLK